MISYLSWKIVELESNKITLLTKWGVWYEVWISDISFLELSLWIDKDFYIYHHITEGNQSLFWFLEKFEKQIFEELIKISWIWWKVWILILSLWWNTLVDSIRNSDNKMIESVKWVWKKMAEKIILELRDKDFVKNPPFDSIISNDVKSSNKLERNLEQDIMSTLTNMGYDKKSIENALSKIPDNLTSMEEIIPALIKEI